jgi:hypothetical protein
MHDENCTIQHPLTLLLSQHLRNSTIERNRSILDRTSQPFCPSIAYFTHPSDEVPVNGFSEIVGRRGGTDMWLTFVSVALYVPQTLDWTDTTPSLSPVTCVNTESIWRSQGLTLSIPNDTPSKSESIRPSRFERSSITKILDARVIQGNLVELCHLLPARHQRQSLLSDEMRGLTSSILRTPLLRQLPATVQNPRYPPLVPVRLHPRVQSRRRSYRDGASRWS